VTQPTPSLKITAFSGIHRIGEEESFYGSALPFGELPKRAVRRLSKLEKGVASCLLGLGDGVGDTPVVYASRYGAIANSLELLKTIVGGEAPSPTSFSLSVHNAAIGAASQLATNKGGHTAIAAGPRSLIAGAVEAWCRLDEGADRIILMFSDCKLPGEYTDFSGEPGDVQFALVVTKGDETAEDSTVIEAGERVAERLLLAIDAGARSLTWPS